MDIILVLILVLSVALAYLTKKDMLNGIYAVIFLMPAYLIRFTLFGIPTTALEIMIYGLFILYLCRYRDIRYLGTNAKTLLCGIMLLLAGVSFSTMFSSDLRISLGVLKGWFIDPLLFFVVYIGTVRGAEDVEKTIRAFIWSGVFVALIAAAYALGGELTFDGRLRAFYESPNYLAMYLAPALLFSLRLPIVGNKTDGSGNLVHWAFSALILLIIVLTRSYGAALGLAAALVFFWASKSASSGTVPTNKKRVMILLLSASAVFLFLSYQKYEQVVTAGERSSLASRFMIWNSAAKMLEDSPFFGIGPGTFQEAYLSYQDRFDVPYLEWAVPQPHNTFLAFYLQSGLLGLAGFILILSWLGRRSQTNDIILLFLVYFLAHGLVDTLYWKNDLALVFWLIIGVGYAGMKKQRRLEE